VSSFTYPEKRDTQEIEQNKFYFRIAKIVLEQTGNNKTGKRKNYSEGNDFFKFDAVLDLVYEKNKNGNKRGHKTQERKYPPFGQFHEEIVVEMRV